MEQQKMVRRTIRSRDTRWAHLAAAWLKNIGVRPNQISVAGVFFALGGGTAFWFLGQPHDRWSGIILALLAAAGIQGRLLCNLFDGMVAVEGGLKSKAGELFNDFPDRLSDTLLLAGAGYAAGGTSGVVLGFTAAILAMLTAYARVLAGAAGAEQHFLGPMAKQHRMALLTFAALVCAALDGTATGRHWTLLAALGLIAAGSAITVIRRLRLAYRELEERP